MNHHPTDEAIKEIVIIIALAELVECIRFAKLTVIFTPILKIDVKKINGTRLC
jgi:hypothetical protein